MIHRNTNGIASTTASDLQEGDACDRVQLMELLDWIEAQAHFSAEKIEAAISATHLKRIREPFSQTVIPAKGSVLASTVMGDWNPNPDYFFHWVRDSAIVMRTVAELAAASDKTERRRWTAHFEDFVRFSLKLTQIDSRSALQSGSPRTKARPEFRKFVREDAEFAALTGDRLLGEPRYNPDGTIDVLRWSCPQYDGPALRALACLGHLTLGGTASPELMALLQRDLDFTRRHAAQPCIGPWEEPDENTHHYYVAVVQLAALLHGRKWWESEIEQATAELRAVLERHWSPSEGVYSAIYPQKAQERDQIIDSACLLAVLDADLPDGPHSVQDPRVWHTLKALEDLFAREFPINRGRSVPALGRSYADRYFGGGAWYVTTLAAASLCYRRSMQDPEMRSNFFTRGDVFMRTVRDLTPSTGVLSEQVDRATGAQTSAQDLTWSYAAFVTAANLRERAAERLGKIF